MSNAAMSALWHQLKNLFLALPYILLIFTLVMNYLCINNPRWSDSDREWVSKLDVSDAALSTLSGHPGSHHIAIVTFATNYGGLGNPETFNYLLDNKRRYANKHGYDFLLFSKLLSPGRHPSWQKVPVALSLLFPRNPSKAYDWVWLLDTDSIITNSTLSLEEHVLGYIEHGLQWSLADVSVVLTKDCNGLNGGSVILHRTRFAYEFMMHTWSEYSMLNHAVRAFWEQGGMSTAIARHHLEGKITWIPQERINAYPVPGCGSAWKPGDFVCHFPSDGKVILKEIVMQRLAENILEPTCKSSIC